MNYQYEFGIYLLTGFAAIVSAVAALGLALYMAVDNARNYFR